MSKVISFSISDRYLDKLRSLYPSLTDNLAVKQFVTDGLDGSLDDALDDNLKTLIESSLSSTLDDVLDERLDGKLKTLIESELDGLLDERLDATVGKLLTSLSDRLSRLEERLDGSLDGSLDDMELLLRMQREASIASPIETVESGSEPISSINEPATDAIASLTEKVSCSPPGEPAIGTLPTVETGIDSVESGSDTEPVKEAIETVGMTAMAAVDYLKSKKVRVSYDSLHRWISREKIPDSPQGKDVRKHLILRAGLYYPIN
ncbi:MAG: hypothetical protein IM550_06500 [Microcystis sp. M54BS1]|uniref:hypothetical protein n=1 Tax=unclassified Microcystis TaxID=2643300 RepID=UPI00257B9496|nr:MULTISPECIES: hypothetical protein [unclassified Microcystis]MCA2538890.1 hypothetical protein [Microcystis sp. M54BS1]MCA2596534.1 hypothetical protein [Microcystis sp. M38BS1]MCA2611989.1 hypothetical protein [Microcystis sp. M27BS1]MCA2504765.1 hypothetical protein [Microcystis sp. M62BS1]MCA2511016.1 hypothetical protein [Microcystis sp. M60BS1]